MKTKDVPALVMLLAGGVYCLIGIRDQILLMDFLVQLLIVLMIFWIIGGIIRMVLDKFMGEIEDKSKSKEDEETEEEDADEDNAESEETEEIEDDSEEE